MPWAYGQKLQKMLIFPYMPYDLSVIVPVYNEKNTILELLGKLVSAPALLNYSCQFIIVNDGSADGTSDLIKNSPYSEDSRFVILSHSKNQGKGAAIRTGLASALGKYTIVQDADLEYDPNDIALLLEHAGKNNLITVFGSRNMRGQNQKGAFAFYWGGKALTWLTNLLFLQNITDEPTCYKLVRTDVLKSLPLACERFEFCPELTALLAKQGVKITELPISYFPRGRQQGKKIGAIDWLEAVWTLLRLRVDAKKDWLLAGLLFLFVGFWYMATWNHNLQGYETETAQSALLLSSGSYQIFRAGAGAVLMYLPFIVLGKLLYPQNVMAFLTVAPIFYSALCSAVLYFVIRELTFKKSIALILALLISFASLMWPYSRVGMEYQTMLWLCVLFLSLLVWRKNLPLPWLVGAALAILAFSKSYGVIFVLPSLLFIALELWKKNQIRQLFKAGFLTALFGPTVLALAAGLGLNLIIFGRTAGAYNLAQEFQVWSWWEGFFGTFFSAGKSIVFYSPLLIVALWYWKKFWQKEISSSVFILSSFLLLLFITAPFSFWSDETLSVRKLMPVIPLLHLPLVYALEEPVWGKLKKAGFALIICASLYFQFINTLYPYWLQLVMFRPYNLDTLTAIRYNPKLSALAVNNRLLFSYLNRIETGKSKNFYYQERSWMRCCTGAPSGDPFLSRMNFSLSAFDLPDIYLVQGKSKKSKIIYLGLDALGLVVVGSFLGINIINRRKEEHAG